LKHVIRANELNLTSRNELNLTNRTELFVNFKRVELELKKGLFRTRVEFLAEPILIESSQAQTGSTRLDSFPALIVHKP